MSEESVVHLFCARQKEGEEIEIDFFGAESIEKFKQENKKLGFDILFIEPLGETPDDLDILFRLTWGGDVEFNRLLFQRIGKLFFIGGMEYKETKLKQK